METRDALFFNDTDNASLQLLFNKTQAEITAQWWLFILKNELAEILASCNRSEIIPIILTLKQEENFLITLTELIWYVCQRPFLNISNQDPIQIDYDFVKQAMERVGIPIPLDRNNYLTLITFLKSDGSVSYQYYDQTEEIYKNNKVLEFTPIKNSIFSPAEKYQVLKKIHDDYAFIIWVNVLSKRQPIAIDEMINESHLIYNFYHHLDGLENIPQARKKKNNIQRLITRYIEDIIAVKEISNADHFSKFYENCAAFHERKLVLSLFDEILKSKTYPNPDLDAKLIEIGDNHLLPVLRGMASLLHLPRHDSPFLQSRQRFIQSEIKKLFSVKENKPRQPVLDFTNFPLRNNHDPMDIFKFFYADGFSDVYTKQPADSLKKPKSP